MCDFFAEKSLSVRSSLVEREEEHSQLQPSQVTEVELGRLQGTEPKNLTIFF